MTECHGFLSDLIGQLGVDLDERFERLGAKMIGFVQQNIGTGEAIVQRVMVMVQVDGQLFTDRVQLVVGEFWEELATGLDRVQRQIPRGRQVVVFQAAPQDPVVEGGVVRDDQPIALEEGRHVFPDFGEGGRVHDVGFVDSVNLDVAPEEIRVGFDQRVKFIDHLTVPDDSQGQRTGTVALAISGFKVHSNKIHDSIFLSHSLTQMRVSRPPRPAGDPTQG